MVLLKKLTISKYSKEMSSITSFRCKSKSYFRCQESSRCPRSLGETTGENGEKGTGQHEVDAEVGPSWVLCTVRVRVKSCRRRQ